MLSNQEVAALHREVFGTEPSASFWVLWLSADGDGQQEILDAIRDAQDDQAYSQR